MYVMLPRDVHTLEIILQGCTVGRPRIRQYYTRITILIAHHDHGENIDKGDSDTDTRVHILHKICK